MQSTIDQACQLSDTENMSSGSAHLIAVRRPIVVHPPQAPAVAAVYDRVADELLTLSGGLERLNDHLDNSWIGRAKETYDRDHDHVEGDLEAVGEMHRGFAAQIRAMTVTVWETVYMTPQGYIID